LVSSALAILMCVAMLIGTTFAWFTDTASTAVNKIQSGKLDVALEMSTDGTNWESAEGKTLTFKTKDNRAADQILWEPGCTYELPQLRVVNNGNLALKYKLIITGINGDAQLNEAIEWTIDGLAVDTEYSLAAGADSASLTISGHMKEAAGNEYQGLSIAGIGITVIATQDTVEHDSTDHTYDAGAVYPVISVDELKVALAAPDSYISLGSDITVPSTQLGSEGGYGKSGLAQTQGGTIDGNGNTISAEGATNTWDATIYTKGGTIKNAEITGGFRGIFIAAPTEDIIIDNVIINPIAYTISCDSGSGKNLIVTNSTLKGWTSYAGTLASAEFTNCDFESNGSYAFLRPYCATTLTNCEFSDDFALDATETSEITLVNCTYNGTPITAANLTSLLGADAVGAKVR
jgi:predicted ribosomally synthesized peptide with SipW-like signal peptide